MNDTGTYPPSPPPPSHTVTIPPPTASTGAPTDLPMAVGALVVLALLGAALVLRFRKARIA